MAVQQNPALPVLESPPKDFPNNQYMTKLVGNLNRIFKYIPILSEYWDGDENANGHSLIGVNNITSTGKITNTLWKVARVMFLPGPLPVSASFTTNGGTVLMFVSGSVFASTNGIVGAQIFVDGLAKTNLQIWANSTSVHMSTPGQMLVLTGLAAGTHSVSFAAMANTLSDPNDNYNVTIQELPF